MAAREDNPLLRVAQAITSGAWVDWKAELARNKGLQSDIEQLRILEALVAAHEIRQESVPGPEGVSASRASNDRAGASQPRPLTFAWGPLKILERIGYGGFSEVYRALDPSLQREVALKLLTREERGEDRGSRRFLREARLLAHIRHPNVLLVHGADEHEGHVGLWADLLYGRTLEQMLADQGPFSAREAALIGIDLCAAVAAVHAQGLIHRDIKTANVMREHGGRIVLMDFGSVSERLGAAGASGYVSPTGTPLYLPPEVVLGSCDAAPAADIYGLGVVLFRLVSGRFPIEAVSIGVLADKHRRGEFLSLRDIRPDLPAAFVHVVEKALAADPLNRCASPGVLGRNLEAALGVGP